MLVREGVDAHDHDYHEVCVVHSGTAIHRTEHDERPLAAGSIVILSPGQTHAFLKARDFQVTNIYYLAEWLLSDLRAVWDHDGLVRLFLGASLFRRPITTEAIPHLTITDLDWQCCLNELDAATRELATSRPSTVFLKSCLMKFMIIVSRKQTQDGGSRTGGFEFRPEISTTLEYVEDVIRQSEPFHLKHIAGQCGISPDHLSHLFKSAVGYAPMDYFQRRRIQIACAWLLNPRHSITDIALALGFSDAAHFSRLFRRHQTMSPRAYRTMYTTIQ